ncbi:hypothetical protein [Burkholderia glumae]|uniref:hypothetical protein n=1 Tax=Burkholderia glumae TaxID=337 RepID=UPI001294B707|nr:hypothetical protein [Burkholderia glumae]MCM2547880.1 hypothetical protein [Burkholderia glumae]NVE21480.1 hypothetical protein [Burkholderia glumae]QGA37691.1 hypothetical protein GAS19_08530 [Burkholderia glumae]
MATLPLAVDSMTGFAAGADAPRARRHAPPGWRVPGPCVARAACFPADEECVQDLLLDYEKGLLRLGVKLLRLGAELTSLPGPYAAPHGAVFLAELDGRPVGCAALVVHDAPHDMPARTAEIRRLHVSAAHAASALDALLARSVAFAAELGCRTIRHTPLPDALEHRESFARHRFMPAAAPDAAAAPPGVLMPAGLRAVPLARAIAPALHGYFSTNARSIT